MTKYNLDTSIWLDYYEKRGPNGKNALRSIIKIIEEDYIIIYSDIHIKELTNLGYSNDEIRNIFSIVKPKNIRKVQITKEQLEESREIANSLKIPKGDVLLALLARDNDAIMVSRDNHFKKLKGVVETKKPEEII